MAFEGYRFRFVLHAGHGSIDPGDEGCHYHSFTITLYLTRKKEELLLYDQAERNIREWLLAFEGRNLEETSLFQGSQASVENIGDILFAKLKQVVREQHMELIRLDISDHPVHTYSVSERLLDHSVNQIHAMPPLPVGRKGEDI